MNCKKYISVYQLISVGFAVLLMVSCQLDKGYTIKGSIRGDVEKARVYLQKQEGNEVVVVDSAEIMNGHFLLEGKVDYPGLYTIIIDRTPEGQRSNPRLKTRSNFYLENSDITFTGDIETLPGFYYNPNKERVEATITGSSVQQLKEKYNALMRPYNKQLKKLNRRYIEEYLTPYFEEHVENTETGIAIVKDEVALNEKMLNDKLTFIRDNVNSVVALDLVSYFFTGMYVDFTIDEINEMVSWFAPDWEGNPLYTKLKKQAEDAKRVALGEKFKDIKLLNPEGELVQLSAMIEPGKYNMLEFWASWCGPCRGEIPHLRRVHQEYKARGFNIISISVDSNDKDWKKAMEEEGMVWTQLRDSKGMNGEVKRVYNVLGVPTCIVLDKDNRIFKTNMRGAYLDAFLEEHIN